MDNWEDIIPNIFEFSINSDDRVVKSDTLWIAILSHTPTSCETSGTFLNQYVPQNFYKLRIIMIAPTL